MRDGLPAAMRRALLAGTFVALVAALALLWAHRFERTPGQPVWHLADLRREMPAVAGVEWRGAPDHPALRLRVDPRNPQVAVRLALPGAGAVEMLHLRFRMSARGLTPGAQDWETGRFMIEWHPPDGSPEVEQDPVGGIKLDQQGDPVAFVARPQNGPAVPSLRLEHLGRAGEFELADLEIIAVHERALWQTGRWFLAIGWFAWIAACIRSWPGISRWRALCAALVWLLMGIHFVIPGPWKIQRPIGGDFRLGEPAHAPPAAKAPPSVAGQTPVVIASGAIASIGKIPERGSLALRVKHAIKQARPLLHVFLLFAPALAFVWLLGRKRALFLAVPLALAIELAQTAFGYGFGWDDVFDLVTDAIGIALAIRVFERMPERLKNWR